MPKPFEKGHKGLKPKGAVNKTTKTAKEIIVGAIEQQSEHIAPVLQSIRNDNPIEYMKIMTKLLDYVVPKKVEQTTVIHGEIPLDKWLK